MKMTKTIMSIVAFIVIIPKATLLARTVRPDKATIWYVDKMPIKEKIIVRKKNNNRSEVKSVESNLVAKNPKITARIGNISIVPKNISPGVSLGSIHPKLLEQVRLPHICVLVM